jgi:hypothetical protein
MCERRLEKYGIIPEPMGYQRVSSRISPGIFSRYSLTTLLVWIAF